MATIKDVAKTAGVSISSVSNYLTGSKNVSKEMGLRIQDAIQMHSYRPNMVASNLKRNRTMTIGLIVTQIDSVFFPQVISGIQKAIEQRGYTLVLYVSKLNPVMEKKYVDMLMAGGAEGIIIDSIVDDADKAYFQKLTTLQTRGRLIPVVSLERNLTGSGISSVLVDNVLGGQMATKHLLDLGCKSIAHIAGPLTVQWARQRAQGYHSALEKAGFPPHVGHGDFTAVGGYAQMKNFLMNSLELDGVFAANDLMAIGAIKAMREHGLTVPKDVRIIGFDNIFISSLLTPSLSTINVSTQGLGEEAANCLLGMIEAPQGSQSKAQAMILPINLLERQSTNPQAVTDWELFY